MTSDEYIEMVNNPEVSAPWDSPGLINDWSDSTKEQYFNLVNAENANQMELERWRLNNDYNTPANQMRRLIEAGINPAAAYQSVNAGNSSSGAGVHQSGTASFHDTSDQLQRVNTIMSGISSIMNTIKGGIDAVEGIQGVQFGYQNNWYDKERAANYKNAFVFNSPSALRDFYGDDAIAYEFAPGIYTTPTNLSLYPEFFNAFKTGAFDYNIKSGNLQVQKDLAERRTRIDNLIQNIFHGLETNASSSEMMRMFMELFAYGAMSKFGGF